MGSNSDDHGRELINAIGDDNAALLRKLLHDGASPNATFCDIPVIAIAALDSRRQCFDALHSGGANLDLPDWQGKTPLMHAAEKGNLRAIKLLLEAGADINARGKPAKANVDRIFVESGTALIMAVKSGRMIAAKALLAADADASVTDADGLTASQWAARKKSARLIALFHVSGGGAARQTIEEFVSAAGKGDLKTVEAAIRSGLDLNARNADWYDDDGGGTLIASRMHGGVTPLMAAAANGHGKIVSALLKAGAKTDILSATGGHSDRSALTLAASAGRAEIVRLLLSAGAKLKPKGQTAGVLHEAAESGNASVVSLLLEAGADPNATVHKVTPLHRAAEHGRTDALRALLNARAKAAARNADGQSPLALAVSAGHPKTVAALLAAGAPVDAKDDDDLTAIELAVSHAKALPRDRRAHAQIAKLLLKAGANPARARRILGKTIRGKELAELAKLLKPAKLK